MWLSSVRGSISLLKSRGFCLCLFQEWNLGIGVLPSRKKTLIGGFGLRAIAGHRIRASQSELGERGERIVDYDAAVINQLLKFAGCGVAVMGSQVGGAAEVRGIQGPDLEGRRLAEFVRGYCLERDQGLGLVLRVELDGGMHDGKPIQLECGIRWIRFFQLSQQRASVSAIARAREGQRGEHLDVS